MTVYELGDERLLLDAGLAFPRDEHLGVDLVLPGLLVPLRPPGAGDRPHPRARGPRGCAAVRPARGRGGGGDRHPSHARADQVEARRARARRRRRSCARPTRRARRCVLGRFTLALRPHGALDPRLGGGGRRHRGGARAAHRRLEARPHAVDGLKTDVGPAGVARQRGRRPDARRLDQRRATGDDGLGASRRRGVPADHPAADRTHRRRLVRLEHPPHAAGGRGRNRARTQGCGRRPLDAQEHEHRPQPRLRRAARRTPSSRRRRRWSCRATRCSSSARAARASRCPPSRASRTATTRTSRSSVATP